MVDAAFARFSLPEVLRVKRLADDLNVLELFHGPTLAFKDLALSVVGQLYSYFLRRRKRHVNIVIGQSLRHDVMYTKIVLFELLIWFRF